MLVSFRGTANDVKKAEVPVVKKEQSKKYVDPLQQMPYRALGYTNDIGVAINELFPTAAKLCWVPALMYFGADIYDKYKNKGNSYDPNGQRMFSQAVFQAFASVLFPMIVGHIGSSVFSYANRFSSDKLSANAKEQTLRFIKERVTNEILQNKNDDTLYAKNLKEFEEAFNSKISAATNTNVLKSFPARAWDFLFGGCEYGAIPNSKQDKLKEFAKSKFEEFVKAKDSITVDYLGKKIDKEIFKHKLLKSAGSFAFLIATMKFIDTFVEKYIIGKCVEPSIDKINHRHIKAHEPVKPVAVDTDIKADDSEKIENVAESETVSSEELLTKETAVKDVADIQTESKDFVPNEILEKEEVKEVKENENKEEIKELDKLNY